MTKAVSVVLTLKCAKACDLKVLQNLEGGAHRIRQVRNDANQIMKLKFAPWTMASSREQMLAKWAAGDKDQRPLTWKRAGNLVIRGRPNRLRRFFSVGKIGQAGVRGATRVRKDFETLARTLQDLMDKQGQTAMKGLKKAYKSVRICDSAQ